MVTVNKQDNYFGNPDGPPPWFLKALIGVLLVIVYLWVLQNGGI